MSAPTHPDPEPNQAMKDIRIAVAALLLAWTLPLCASAAGWSGRYVYEATYGRSAGGSHIGEDYEVTLRNEAPQACRISISGFQRDEVLLCSLEPAPERITLRFLSYESGATRNVHGVEVYRAGAPLIALERRKARDGTERLVTHWFALQGLDGGTRKPGMHFRLAAPAAAGGGERRAD